MRLIDADELEKTLGDWIREHWTEAFTGDDVGSEFIDMIDHEETIDAAPVIHAHWIRKFLVQKGCYECSNCRRYSTLGTNYCGSCGAKMDEVYGREKLNQIHNLIFNQKLN